MINPLLRLLVTAASGAGVAGGSAAWGAEEPTDSYLAADDECGPDHPYEAHLVLDHINTGWRPLVHERAGEFGVINERENAKIILDTFKARGLSTAVALAAVVNAWSESKLDNTAVMDDPFVYFGTPYPYGSGAVGLFQLLPSERGAGGPSGPPEGYSREFEGRRFAGTRYQARRWGVNPDPAGRTYYDATDPAINTERIILEVERDGKRLLAADARGATIAELAHIFAADIERPQGSTWYRRDLAVRLLGPDLALSPNPNELFVPHKAQPEVDHAGELLALNAYECRAPSVSTVSPAPNPRSAMAMMFGAVIMVLASLLGLFRTS